MKTNNWTASGIGRTDEELVKLALKNPEYFEDIVIKYQKPIVGFHYNFLKNPQDAEDLAQDTFLKIYLNLRYFDEKKGEFKNWIFKIAKNIFIDFLRKKGGTGGKKEIVFSSLVAAEEYFFKVASSDNFSNGEDISY